MFSKYLLGLLVLAILFIVTSTQNRAEAATVILQKPCTNQIAFQDSTEGAFVSEVTLKAFTDHNINFNGNEMGIHSIYNTPTNDAAIEVLSDDEMKVHGWCYKVDGVMPDQLPHLVPLLGPEVITWFYGYAHFKNNQWISYCDVNTENTPHDYCGNSR